MKKHTETPRKMIGETAAPKRDTMLGALIAVNAVLFLAMLVLSGIYLNLSINGGASALPEIPASDRWILTGSGNNLQSGANNLLSPSFIGFKTGDGAMTAATFDTTSRKNLQKELESAFEALLSGEVRRTEIRSDADKLAFAADLCKSERYLFCSLFGELPAASLVPSVRAGGFPVLEENFFVRYIFLLPDENDETYAVCLDDDYNAVFLYPKEKMAYTVDRLSAYNGVRGYAGFSFADGLPESAVFTTSFDVDSVVVLPSGTFYNYDLGEEKTKNLLKTLGFNINTVKNIRSGGNTVSSFVDGERELTVSLSDNRFTFSSGTDGIPLSDFLGYYPADGKSYTFNDQILCVKYLLGALDRILVGGDAAPSLVGITRDADGSSVFRLKYFYNGVMLTENAADVTVAIQNDCIKKLSVVTLFCDGGSLTKPVLPQRLTLPLFDGTSGYAYHAMFENDPDTNQVKLVWVAGKAGNESWN